MGGSTTPCSYMGPVAREIYTNLTKNGNYCNNQGMLSSLTIPIIGGSKGGQGGHGPPKGLTKIIKMAQFAAFCIIKKKFAQGACPQTPVIH